MKYIITIILLSLVQNYSPKHSVEIAKAFGVIDDSYSVNEMGAYNHIIPLDIVPGINDMAPQLSLVYDSRNGSSILGKGWSITGLSKISRTGKTLIHHGEADRIGFNIEDGLALDGQTLVLTSGEHFKSGAIYKTENETFQDIIAEGEHCTLYGSKGCSSNSPNNFVVRKTNGTRYYYGKTNNQYQNSKVVVISEDQPEILEWNITRIEDQFGKFIEFEYFIDDIASRSKCRDGQYDRNKCGNHISYIKSIKYTGTNDLKPSHEVVFNYKNDNNFSQVKYFSGYKINQTQHLTSIDIRSHKKTIHTYSFEYSNNKNQLRSISKCSSNGECLNPTKFDWTTPLNSKYKKKSIDLNKNQKINGNDYNLIDLTGDGIDELAYLIKNKNKNDQLSIFSLKNFDSPTTIDLKAKNVKWEDITFSDFNGDGTVDVFVLYNKRIPTLFTNYTTSYKNLMGEAIVEEKLSDQNWLDLRAKINEKKLFTDIDGNGLTDIVVLSNSGENKALFLPYPGIENTLLKFNKKLHSDDNQFKHLLGDFDGDGRQELLIFDKKAQIDSEGQIVEFNSNRIHFSQLKTISSGAKIDFKSNYLNNVDINADGISDLIRRDDNSGKIYYSLNNGQYLLGEIEISVPEITKKSNLIPGHFIHLSSLQLWVQNGKESKLYEYSYGTFQELNTSLFNDVDTKYINQYRQCDINADGLSDLILATPPNNPTKLDILYHDAWFPGLVSNVIDGHNNVVNVYYRNYLKNSEDIKQYNYPIAPFLGKMQVVDKIEFSNGIGSLNSIEYVHNNMAIDKLGRGLQGFESIEIIDNASGIKTVTNYIQEFPLNGKIKQQRKYTESNKLFFELENKWDIKLYQYNNPIDLNLYADLSPNIPDLILNTYNNLDTSSQRLINYLFDYNSTHEGQFNINVNRLLNCTSLGGCTVLGSLLNFNKSKIRYFPVLKTSTTTKYEINEPDNPLTVSHLSFRYDPYGNPTKTVQILGDSTGYINQKLYTERDDGIFKIIHLVEKEVNTPVDFKNNHYGNPRTVRNTYNEKGLLSATYNQENGSKSEQLTTINKFNSLGMLRQTCHLLHNKESRCIEYEYEKKNYFLNREINSIGHNKTYKYDMTTGQVTTEVDANKLITKYEYDDFGTISRITTPDGNTKSIHYSLEIPKEIRQLSEAISYSTRTTETNKTPITSYFDNQGRNIITIYKNISKGINKDLDVIIENRYNEIGQLVESFNPSFYTIDKGCLTFKAKRSSTIFVYDEIGRNVTTILPDGAAISTKYLRNQTIEYDLKKNKRITKTDKRGNIIEVVDANNYSITYNYDLWGNQIDIIKPSRDTIHSEYDILGRKILMRDNNLGQTSYLYNGFNELISENSNGINTKISYDKIGRIVNKKIGKEDAIFWVYDNEFKGSVSMIKDHNKNKKEFTYDKLGRIIKLKSTIGKEKPFYNKFKYDKSGKLIEREFPSGYSLLYEYENDILTGVLDKEDKKRLYSVREINALGQITETQFGNGVVTYKSYNNLNNQLESIKSTKIELIESPYNLLTQVSQYCDKSKSTISIPITTKRIVNATIQDQEYKYDANYNIINRSDHISNMSETFEYDNLNRLTNYFKNGKLSSALTYDELGSIISKSDVGRYVYSSVKNNQLSSIITNTGKINYSYDERGNLISSSRGLDIQYTEFNQPRRIRHKYKEKKSNREFKYDENLSQIYQKEELNGSKTEIFSPNSDYEYHKNGKKRNHIHYIKVNGELIGVHSIKHKKKKKKQATQEINFIHNDHLGSIGIVTDKVGNVLSRFQFDPFGKRSEIMHQKNYLSISHGFTGHKMYDELGIINMKGRLYSTFSCRMLSPDPFIINPKNLQSFNRYSYVLNNPLNNIDPSGYRSLKKAWKSVTKPFRKVGKAIGKFVKNVGRTIKKVVDVVVEFHKKVYNEAKRFVKKYAKQIIVIAAAAAITYISAGTLAGFGAALVKGALIGGVIGAGHVAINGGDVGDILNGAITGAMTGAAAASVGFAGGKALGSLGISSSSTAKTIMGVGRSVAENGVDAKSILKGVAASFIPQDLGINGTNIFSTTAAAALASGVQGYILNGKKGMERGIMGSLALTAFGHTAGLFRSGGIRPVGYYKGQAVYRANNTNKWDSYFQTKGLETNVSLGSTMTIGSSADLSVIAHESAHFHDQGILGEYYLPVMGPSQTLGSANPLEHEPYIGVGHP